MALTREQFDALRAKGLSVEQIVKFEQGQKPAEKKSFLRKVGDVFTSSAQKFGQTLGTAASVVDPATKKLREEAISSTQKLADDYIAKAKVEKDKDRAKKYLEAAQKLADTEGIDIYNNPEYQKTAKQIIGEGLGTGLEVLSFGTFGAGKLPTAVKALKPGANILRSAGTAAKIGGAYGAGFGVSEAMMKDKSLGGIALGGITGGALGALGGAVLGGAITGGSQGITGLLGKASKYSTEMRNILGEQAVKRLEKTSKDLVKMSPTASKNEAKWNKNTPQFIANEYVMDGETLKPKSILELIDSDGRRIDTNEAMNALRNKYHEESSAFNNLIKDSGEYVSLNKLRDNTIASIGDDFKYKGTDYESALKYLNKEIDAYKRNLAEKGLVDGNDVLVPISDMSKIKSGLWAKTSNFNPSQVDKLLSDLNYKMGQSAKDLIEESVEDTAVKRMNQRLGDFASALKVLENANGKILPGGFFGRQFTRLAGTVAGLPGGIGGSIVGNITGGVLADIMVNPKIKTSLWTKLVQQLGKQKNGQSIIDEAVEILSKRNQERAARKLLDAPQFIPLKPKLDSSKLFTQEEAQQLLDALKIKEAPKLLNAPGQNPILLPAKKLNVLPKGKGEILKSTPKAKPLVSKVDNELIKEAKKYKSADEFVKSQGTTGIDSGFRDDAIFGLMEENRLTNTPDLNFLLKSNNIPENSKKVIIYRSAPGDFRNGDFVGLKKETAQSHIRSSKDKIWSKEVNIDDLIQGADQYEFIYAPKKSQIDINKLKKIWEQANK